MLHDAPHMDDFGEMPPLPGHSDPELDAELASIASLPEAPSPDVDDFDLPPAPEQTAERFDLDESPEEPAPVAPVAAPAASAEQRPTDHREEAEPLPDFTAEEMNAAERLSLHVDEQQELPTLEDVTPVEPPKADHLYVPATQYRAALEKVNECQKAIKRGDAALGKLGAKITSHKEGFSQFAETLNAIQENLIQMDNILIGQR